MLSWWLAVAGVFLVLILWGLYMLITGMAKAFEQVGRNEPCLLERTERNRIVEIDEKPSNPIGQEREKATHAG